MSQQILQKTLLTAQDILRKDDTAELELHFKKEDFPDIGNNILKEAVEDSIMSYVKVGENKYCFVASSSYSCDDDGNVDDIYITVNDKLRDLIPSMKYEDII